MTDKDLEIIKSRTLVLREREVSSDVILVDNIEGDMYFAFELMYVPDNADGKIRYLPVDDFHAKVEIDTTPTSMTEIAEPAKIGTYQGKYSLYFGVAVEPAIEQTKSHNVIITFYRGKEVCCGSK